MVNRRKRLEKQKARLADQALVDQLAMDLVKQGLPGTAQTHTVPSIHHPLYFCIRSHYDGSDQKWNWSTQLAWLKHQLQCMFMSSEWARAMYPVNGPMDQQQLKAMMGSYARFPAVWQGNAHAITMAEACEIASVEDDTPKRHDLQWMNDTGKSEYLDRVCGVEHDPLAFGQHFFMSEPVKEESKDFLDVLFGDGKGAKLSEIAKALSPEGGGIYGEDHFHNEVKDANLARLIGNPIPNWRLPSPEDDQ